MIFRVGAEMYVIFVDFSKEPPPPNNPPIDFNWLEIVRFFSFFLLLLGNVTSN